MREKKRKRDMDREGREDKWHEEKKSWKNGRDQEIERTR